MQCLLPSLALNFEVMYSSPGSLFFFLLPDALGQPERLRGDVDHNQNLRSRNPTSITLSSGASGSQLVLVASQDLQPFFPRHQVAKSHVYTGDLTCEATCGV